MSEAQHPPAWHPDPWQQAPWRWWDGMRWTEQTHQGTDQAGTSGTPQAGSSTTAVGASLDEGSTTPPPAGARGAAGEADLLAWVTRTESEDSDGVAPAPYERLAILYRKRADLPAEVAILERFAHQKHAPGVMPSKLLKRLEKAKAKHGETEDGIPRTACPHCGVVLAPPPKANRKCPDCSEQIVVRTQQGRKLTFTPDEAKRFDAARERGYREREARRRADGLGVSDEDWEQEERRLQARFGRKPSAGDVYWGLANTAVTDAASKGDWHGVSTTYRQMALHLKSEGREFRHLLRECLRASIQSDSAQHKSIYGRSPTHFRVLGCRSDCEPCALDADAIYSTERLMSEDGPLPHDCDFCACGVLPVRRVRGRTR